MEAGWVLVNTEQEQDIARIARIAEAVRKSGREATILSIKEAYDDNFSERHPAKKEIVLCGPVRPVLHLSGRKEWLSWLNLEKIKCSTYYAAFGQFLLNARYYMLPLAEVRRRYDMIIDSFYREETLESFFMRPDQNDKSFNAGVMSRKDVSDILRVTPADTLCVVAPVIRIRKEYRCFVHRKTYLTGSLYKENGAITKSSEIPEEVIRFVNNVGHLYVDGELPPVWVMDVGQTASGLGVLEVSGSSCAGFYEADHDLIVGAINKEADKYFEKPTDG